MIVHRQIFILSVVVFLSFTCLISAGETIWKANADCQLSKEAKGWKILSTGKDPFLTTTLADLPAGPYQLTFRMQSRGQGGGQIFWGTSARPGFTPENSVKYAVTHSGEWEIYRVVLPTEEKITQLRFDPLSSAGELFIDSFQLEDARGQVLRSFTGADSAWFSGQKIDGNATLTFQKDGQTVTLKTTNRLAGAIDSLQWNGTEMIDSLDHGRQLQSASSFSNEASFGKHHAEAYNPTEAGSRNDGIGPRSTSQLLYLHKTEHTLHTINRMAFWLAPGQTSEGKPAINKAIRSNHLLTKRVQLGYQGNAHLIAYDVTFSLPGDERWVNNQLEALTGYMPVAFDQFWGYDATRKELQKLSSRAGEQPLPVVLADASGQKGMGVLARESPIFGKPSYGRFAFPEHKTMKWNAVYRKRMADGLSPGDYSFSLIVIVGSLDEIRKCYNTLIP